MRTITTKLLIAETVTNRLHLSQAITRKNQACTSWEPNKNNCKWSAQYSEQQMQNKAENTKTWIWN